MTARKRRNKGEGSFQILKNGKYKMTITIGVGVDGKQKRKAVTANSRKELMEKVAEVRLKYKVGDYQKLIKPMTFHEYTSKWIERKSFSVSDNTKRNYKYVLSKCSYINDMFMNKITAEDINHLLLSLKDEVATGSLKTIKSILGAIFNTAMDEEVIAKSPLRGTVELAKSKRKVDLIIPTEDEVKKVLAVAKGYQEDTKRSSDVWLYQFLLLAVATGMRRGELAGLKWSNVNFDNNTIKVEEQATLTGMSKVLKTSSSYREIAVEPKVLEVLRTVPRKDNKEYIFMQDCASAGALLAVITESVRRVYDEVGLDRKLTLHSLRHFHATQLIKNNINVKVVSKRLGHSSVQITLDAYVHWLPSMDREASLLVGKNYVIN